MDEEVPDFNRKIIAALQPCSANQSTLAMYFAAHSPTHIWLIHVDVWLGTVHLASYLLVCLSVQFG